MVDFTQFMQSVYVQVYQESHFTSTLYSKPYKEIVELVQTHYSPKPTVIVQRLKFNLCSRQQGESVSAFIARLRQLTEYCDIDHSLEAMLCDRLVCGINDSRIQRRLLQDDDLTFETALKSSLMMESANRNTHDVLNSTSSNFSSFLGYWCGEPHTATHCSFRDSECHYCHRKGHIAKVCRSNY